MKVGFAKVDITPRPGVEMAGFGPFLHRIATEVHDPLHARAMAVTDGEDRWLLIVADLLGTDPEIARETREILNGWTGLEPRQVMLQATHTHSAPAVLRNTIGWGETDSPYMARLPWLLARAGREALAGLREVKFSCANVPIEGIGYNRELDQRPSYDDALRDDWRPGLPEHTDTTGWIIRADAGEDMTGFLAHYSCHPVVCCEKTHSLHGDYCGVAMNRLEAENPGAVGIFLQSAHGDLNACVCHQPQEESLRALDVIADRFARQVRQGLSKTKPVTWSTAASAVEAMTVRHELVSADELREEIETRRQAIGADPKGDADGKVRYETVLLVGAERMLQRVESGRTLDEETQFQAFRLGEALIIGTPFELFRGIKDHIGREVSAAPVLVLSNANDSLGYAVSDVIYAQKGPDHYARDFVPRMRGTSAFQAGLEDDIVAACLRLAGKLL